MAEDHATRQNIPTADPLLGKVLNGRFRILEKLGAGGMGTVYKAIQTPLDRIVALKVLNSNYDSKRDPGFQRRFFLEASVTSKLKHPNTITVIDYGKTDDGIYYIAMEFVEGVTLAQVLVAEGALAWNRVLHIGQQVCRSLREAHKAGLIHRDLKPANVMVCTEETDGDLVKVLDFGLVKPFTPDSAHAGIEKSELTQAGVFLGSPQYMAPEQARNLADPRSDIYSLGVVLYQMLIGKPPFFAEQSIDVIVKHMKEPPPPFASVRPDLEIPADVEAVVMKCLAKNPDDRYQSMDDLLEGIRAAALGGGISGAFSGARNTPSPMSSSHLPNSGAFRAMPPTPSGPQRIPQSGPHRLPPGQSGAHRGGSISASRPNTLALDISVETSGVRSSARGQAAAQPPQSSGKKLLPLWIFLGSMGLGIAVVLAIFARSNPPPAPARVEPVVAEQLPPRPVAPIAAPQPGTSVPPPQPAAKVVFQVHSDPPGARVYVGDEQVGITPFDLERERGPGGAASVELIFTADGYQRYVASFSGEGNTVQIDQKLQKKPLVSAPPSKGPKTKPSQYKDDPY